jgi:ribosomal protein S18 acetylase RimI-like enzyme
LELEQKLAQAFRSIGDADQARRPAQIAAALAEVERTCYTLHQIRPWDRELLRRMLRLCEELLLVEEAQGWARLGLRHYPDDSVLREAERRVAQLASTSARHPPSRGNLP